MPRQPARVHKTFYRLKLRANFFVGAGLYEKTSFCTARAIGSDVPGIKFVAPWTVVRSDEFVNKKAGIIAALTKGHAARNAVNAAVVKDLCLGRPPYTAEELDAAVVKDLCGSHTAAGIEGAVGPKGTHNICIGTPQQPNNDNNVTGPTS